MQLKCLYLYIYISTLVVFFQPNKETVPTNSTKVSAIHNRACVFDDFLVSELPNIRMHRIEKKHQLCQY